MKSLHGGCDSGNWSDGPTTNAINWSLTRHVAGSENLEDSKNVRCAHLVLVQLVVQHMPKPLDDASSPMDVCVEVILQQPLPLWPHLRDGLSVVESAPQESRSDLIGEALSLKIPREVYWLQIHCGDLAVCATVSATCAVDLLHALTGTFRKQHGHSQRSKTPKKCGQRESEGGKPYL